MGNKRHFKVLPVFIFLILLLATFLFLKNRQHPKSSLLPNKPKSPAQQFILIGDTGTGSEAQYRVAESIGYYCATKNCEAVFILGDVIYDKGVSKIEDPQFMTKFEEPYKDINLPFYILFGNHDYDGCRDCYIQYDKSSAKWEMPLAYYVKKFENISFYAINTEEFDKTQIQWLTDYIKNDTSTWKIVMGHRPLKTFESTKLAEVWRGQEDLKHAICNAVDFYISGHAHILEDPGKIDGCGVRQLISGSGGAYPRSVKKPHEGQFYFEDNGFLVLNQNGISLTFEFYDKNGKQLYQLISEK